MADLDEQLDRGCADGRLTMHDAEEVRRFRDFLEDAVPRPPESCNAAGARAWREHYPEDYERAVAERDARDWERVDDQGGEP